jgi:hypothetical protein
MTGSKTIPPLGFPKQFSVKFVHGCAEGRRCRPTVSTCDITLKIPVHLSTEQDMRDIMKSAIKDCSGFGNL